VGLPTIPFVHTIFIDKGGTEGGSRLANNAFFDAAAGKFPIALNYQ
jgi:hypothetical protein